MILARTGSDAHRYNEVILWYSICIMLQKYAVQCNKEAMMISHYFVPISCLLINLQVISLNLLNPQCNKNVVTIRSDLVLISCLFIIHQVLSIELFEWIIFYSLLLGIQFYVV